MPVLIRINGKIYPSMILENVRLLNGSKRIKVIAKEHGIDEVLVSKKAGIPVNHNAEMYISYADPGKYVNMSATDVITGNFNENKIKNRIVVVGLDAAGLSVLKYTPHGLTTDQNISAQALDTLLTGKYLLRTPQADTYEIVFMAFLLLLLIILLPRIGVLLSVPILLFVETGVAYGAFLAYANRGFLVDPSWIMLSVFLIWSHSTYNNFATQSRLRKQIKKQFEHYLDPGMVFWNAPIENKKHRELAVKSALEMTKALKQLNNVLVAEGLPQINIGIGINTGEALVGNMGSEQRFDYSVIGDAVNLASRLESSSKTLGKTIVIGEETRKTIENNFNFEYIDSIMVKGKSEKIKVYTTL
jgi:hypothetical protein